MEKPKESGQLPTSQEIEAFDVFGETVQQRLQKVAESIDELNEKSDILEYEWVFEREDWHVYDGARYGRCRLISISKDDNQSYTVIAAKAWEEDKDLITSGQISPAQYVRYVSPKAQVVHFSQAASRLLDQAMGEWSARFRAGDESYDIDPYEYLYEAGLGNLWQAAVQLPEVDVYEDGLGYERGFRHMDILNQAIQVRRLALNSVRKPAWEWGIFNEEPSSEEYASAIEAIKERVDVPDLSGYKSPSSSYRQLLSNVKSELSRLWNARYNIDDLFFLSPGSLDPEKAGLYHTRFEAAIKEVEQVFVESGYDPKLYWRDVIKFAKVRIYHKEHDHLKETHENPIVWSDQTTVEALAHVLKNLGGNLVDEAIDNSLLVKSMYGEMPSVLTPLFQKMSEISLRDTVSTSDKALIEQFIVLPKKLTVGIDGEITQTQPETMRQWVESINDWSMQSGDPFNYLYYIHTKPDGTVLYAELRIQPGDDVTDIFNYARTHSAQVLLANFYPTAITYLQKYYSRDTLLASDYHGAIHIKHFGDQPMNDGKNKKIEFVHNA